MAEPNDNPREAPGGGQTADPAPRATYRLQFTPTFGFDDGRALAPYLQRLGVSHLYASPVLQAQPGSTHGYDVIDHQRLNAELGGGSGFDALAAALADHGLSMVVDIVPNHMAVATPGNRWWTDVLQNGRASRHAPFFDIDWTPPEPRLANRILVPVLGDHYGRVLEAGELRVVRDADAPGALDGAGELYVAYYEHRFPLSPRTLADLIDRVAAAVGSEPLEFLARSLRRLPSSTVRTPAAVVERQVDGPVLLRILGLMLANPDTSAALDAELAVLNADRDALDALLTQQSYRLAYWRLSDRELDYRRFFDVDQLVGLRVEDPHVFAEVHEQVLAWMADGRVGGLRIDHIDGLRDPGEYLDRLRRRIGSAYLVVEKILEPGEVLRPDWPVAGTTGYEFGAMVTALLVDPEAEKPLTELYAELAGDDRPFEEVLLESKRQVMGEVLAAEVNRLTEACVRVCERRRRVRDFSRHELHEALREVLAAFTVYRAYVTDEGAATAADHAVVGRAVATAGERRPDLDPELFPLLREILLGRDPLDAGPERDLRARFQQVSGPVMAKSKEDTAFYRYVRLLALNEVGSDPARFGADPATYHEEADRTQQRWPATMSTLTTHDTKRSEDVRARLAVLSELPERWAATVRRWHERHRGLPGAGTVDGRTELYLYQTLVGAHPLPFDRAWTHLIKAVREAKLHTSWVQPDEAYEADLRRFTEALLDDPGFGADLDAFVRPLVMPGRVNALAQKLLQLTAPGVPDCYQGQELWDLSLVDPDNRRPVDFALRAHLLDALDAGDRPNPAGLDDPDDRGLAKLHLVRRTLAVRADRPATFGAGPAGAHRALATEGDGGDLVVAAGRGGEVAVVVPRLTVRHPVAARATRVVLPPGDWVDELVDGRRFAGTVAVADLLAPFPVALLTRAG
jgi:(1->4)-alpha-D-glucan 1-alpha-D-glucosylmutase